ncbi:MAG: NADH-quinone oxidoreductase subunit NuoE [Cyclobacteriaceae bacterium]|nr:NADH-quinone oxidoreductase subunit NuoE [Cyclobacteriaceae bacterium]MCH8515255.1 NADH-quinone oxidoreductase subunit NuoE [Cyclobacteriaceae bacterium]
MSTEEIKFSEESLALVKKTIAKYPEGRQKSALLPILHLAQAEFDGWLSVPVMDYVASLLDIQPIEVYEVASFYSMFNLKPVGKCILEVCHTSSCWLRGADDIVDHISNKLNIKVGETTADGMFTLKTVECLGSCGSAPMLMCGSQYHEHLTFEKVDGLIDNLRNENKRTTYLDEVKVENY